MADDPKYVRLAGRVSRGICVDLNTGWSISGLDVQPFPDAKRRPTAATFVRDRLRRGVLESASRAEYEEVQEVRDKLSDNFSSRVKRLKDLEPIAALVGISAHQESQVRRVASELAEELEHRRTKKVEEDDFKANRRRRKETAKAARRRKNQQDSEEESEDSEDEVSYDDQNVNDLRAELNRRGLSTGGNKPDLVARLVESDEDADDDDDDDDDEEDED